LSLVLGSGFGLLSIVWIRNIYAVRYTFVDPISYDGDATHLIGG